MLILDEPANGMDSDGIRWMRLLLRDFAIRGGTVLLSSHLLAEVQATVDRLVVIRDGRIVADGGHDRFVDDEVTWTLAGGEIDELDIGMGGLGGQWAAARPSLGLAWAFLTTRVGDHDRAQTVEAALIDAAESTG